MAEQENWRSLRRGGLAAWSIRHPIGITMITLALVVLGAFAFLRLSVDLLPQIIYPEIRVRILDPGVPARIMEDQVTRQLEEQLAITENAVSVYSESSEGASLVQLDFPYGSDIDLALRDASTRLDRAKRFLPDSIDPPIIYKRDPSQIAVAEYVVSSADRDAVALRSWVDYSFSKWFLNLPGVASVEVGGGLIREIQVLPNLLRLAAVGLSLTELETQIQQANQDIPGGRLEAIGREFSSRTQGRFTSVEQLKQLPLTLPDGSNITLAEVAEVRDTHEDEILRVRFNGTQGIKVSIQKQPRANSVDVVDAVDQRIQWMQSEGLLPGDIHVDKVSDQAVYVRHALNNAALAGLSGALLAMLVVYIFLGDIRRTLVIGSAMPIAIAVTFVAMSMSDLTLNIMTLGGLAIGIGMLVDNTIVMLENIQRHQKTGEDAITAGTSAAREVNSAIVASTSTNLAAILPFLLIGGLTGLLFRELIFTVAAAIFSSMLVALTLVPAWASHMKQRPANRMRLQFDKFMHWLQDRYEHLLQRLIAHASWQLGTLIIFILALFITVPHFLQGKSIFLPSFDEGAVYVNVSADPGIALENMDVGVTQIEQLLMNEPTVKNVFVITGGFIFGRTEREESSSASIYVELVPSTERDINSQAWVGMMTKKIEALELVGFRVYMRVRGVRGLRTSASDDEVTLRVQGPDLETLDEIAHTLTQKLRGIPGLRNASFPGEEVRQELAINVDRVRAAQLGLSVEAIGKAIETALNGRDISDYIDGDREYNILMRLPKPEIQSIVDLRGLLLFAPSNERAEVYLGDVAEIQFISAPSKIQRDQQQRITEVTASLTGTHTIAEVNQQVQAILAELALPNGYRIYDVGEIRALQQGQSQAVILIGLAIFLVFVVMAVQYESLRNPIVILLGIPFAAIGAAVGLPAFDVPLSMPIWLGLIMLAGIVVNNAIVLVEYIELLKDEGLATAEAIARAGAIRLRPIMMTTLTTVVGLLPLSIGVGQGSEMLQPLAQTIVFGLSFSLLVSLLLIPVFYYRLHPQR